MAELQVPLVAVMLLASSTRLYCIVLIRARWTQVLKMSELMKRAAAVGVGLEALADAQVGTTLACHCGGL